MSSEADDSTFTWVTRDSTMCDGSEVELMIAIHLGDVRDVEYDPATGLYRVGRLAHIVEQD
jgi:hypothetical protein